MSVAKKKLFSHVEWFQFNKQSNDAETKYLEEAILSKMSNEENDILQRQISNIDS